MEGLTYHVLYSPEKTEKVNANYLCSDLKVHIRLRDYDHEEVISGVINKLTYLVTYLIQRGNLDRVDADKAIEKFVNNNADFDEVVRAIGYRIKVTKNYRKKGITNPLGSMGNGVCPMEDGYIYGNLAFFLCKLNLTLDEFLWNDAYEIVISKAKETNVYKKFLNKVSRKTSRKKKGIEYISLF